MTTTIEVTSQVTTSKVNSCAEGLTHSNEVSTFPFEDYEIGMLTNEKIAKAYERVPILSNLFSEVKHVRRLSKGYMIKEGPDQLQEARNMEFLATKAPSVRIPRLVRAFKHGPYKFQYTFMEYVEGDLLSHCLETYH